MFAPCPPSTTTRSTALLLATAAVLIAASVASPVSREDDLNAIEQPGRKDDKEGSYNWGFIHK